MGYPILVKAVMGGGGKGMKLAMSAGELTVRAYAINRNTKAHNMRSISHTLRSVSSFPTLGKGTLQQIGCITSDKACDHSGKAGCAVSCASQLAAMQFLSGAATAQQSRLVSSKRADCAGGHTVSKERGSCILW